MILPRGVFQNISSSDAFISRDSLPERSMTLTASHHGVFEWLHSGLYLEMKCSALLSIKQSKQSREEDAEDAPRVNAHGVSFEFRAAGISLNYRFINTWIKITTKPKTLHASLSQHASVSVSNTIYFIWYHMYMCIGYYCFKNKMLSDMA